MLLVTFLILSFVPQLKVTDPQEKVAGSLTGGRWSHQAAACIQEHCPKMPRGSWLFYVPRAPIQTDVTTVTPTDAGIVSQGSCSLSKMLIAVHS